jgi:hypothetical protein
MGLSLLKILEEMFDSYYNVSDRHSQKPKKNETFERKKIAVDEYNKIQI